MKTNQNLSNNLITKVCLVAFAWLINVSIFLRLYQTNVLNKLLLVTDRVHKSFMMEAVII